MIYSSVNSASVSLHTVYLIIRMKSWVWKCFYYCSKLQSESELWIIYNQGVKVLQRNKYQIRNLSNFYLVPAVVSLMEWTEIPLISHFHHLQLYMTQFPKCAVSISFHLHMFVFPRLTEWLIISFSIFLSLLKSRCYWTYAIFVLGASKATKMEK